MRDTLRHARQVIVGGVFVACLFGIAGASVNALSTLSSDPNPQLAVLTLFLGWVFLAYFPAQSTYAFLNRKALRACVACERCAYDLTANESGVCPECGNQITIQAVLRQAQRYLSAMPRDREPAKMRKWSVCLIAGTAMGAGLSVQPVAAWAHRRFPDRVTSEFETAENPFTFLRWNRRFEMAADDPDSVFAVSNRVIRARLTFGDASHRALESFALYDPVGRVWINADIEKNKYMVNLYKKEDLSPSAEPIETLIDTDSDGVVDHRKDWATGSLSCMEQPVLWESCVESKD